MYAVLNAVSEQFVSRTMRNASLGEALIAVCNEPKLQLEQIRAAIKSKGLSNIYLPKELKYVRDIPKLGTGKVNHRELQQTIAEDKTVK